MPPLLMLSSVSVVVAGYALHVASASSSEPPSASADLPPLPLLLPSACSVALFLQVLLTVKPLVSVAPSSRAFELCFCRLQLVAVVVLLLLLLSKPDSVSLQSVAPVPGATWRLKLLR